MVKQGFGCLRGCQMREANVQTGEQTKVMWQINRKTACLINAQNIKSNSNPCSRKEYLYGL